MGRRFADCVGNVKAAQDREPGRMAPDWLATPMYRALLALTNELTEALLLAREPVS